MTNQSVTSFPLVWPAAWERTAYRNFARFMTPLADARRGLLYELDLMGATDVVLSCNVAFGPHGGPRDSRGRSRSTPSRWIIDDPGAAVYFTVDGEDRCIPCDRWNSVDDNVQAIRKTVEALRGLDRWGTHGIVAAAFRGFAALPESTSAAAWWTVLGVPPDARPDEIDAAFRRLARIHHPDKGGDAATFRQVSEAYRQAREQRVISA